MRGALPCRPAPALRRRVRAGAVAVMCWLALAVLAPAAPPNPEPMWRAVSRTPDGAWVWEMRFQAPRRIGALGQVLGDHPFVLRNAPRDYEWQGTVDGHRWATLPDARVREERRLFRVLRFPRARDYAGLRLVVRSVGNGTDNAVGPAVMRADLLESPDAAWPGSSWILVVNSTHDPALPGHGQEFIPLARSCPGWESLGAQQVWVPDVDPGLVDVEPKPLAVFFSGSFKDWCEVDRRHWRGVERVLARGRDPMWASCGGAQALAILADRGTRVPWDCPHCRDAEHPRLPIYGHIGHRGKGPHRCGDYGDCVFERGPHEVRQVVADPVFAGLPPSFTVMQSHCGEIVYAPRGWQVVATGGAGSLTRNQCLRWGQRPIYAAQFHIEMEGTPEVSRAIMSGFLELASRHRR